LSPALLPLVERVRENKEHWLEMSEVGDAPQNRKVIDGEDSRQ